MNSQSTLPQIVAHVVADKALDKTPWPIDKMTEIVNGMDAPALPDEIRDAVKQAVTQAPLWVSKRMWSALLGVVSSALIAALLDPATQAAITAWLAAQTGTLAPVLIPLLGAALAYLSKRSDPRPVRVPNDA